MRRFPVDQGVATHQMTRAGSAGRLRDTHALTPRPVNAFSLVELVIVIVIIAIIAAIAVPRFSTAAAGSGEAALTSSLSTLRRAIETYAAEHEQTFPGTNADGQGGGAGSPEAFISQLTKYSAANGTVSDTPGPPYVFGPYLASIPELTVGSNKGNRDVAIDAANSPPLVTGAGEAWVFNPTTGKIIANSDDATEDGLRTFDEL